MSHHERRHKYPIAYWMDEAFRIPGTTIRFGLDPIIGLVPGIGEWITTLLAAYLVMSLLSKKEVPLVVAWRMVANVAIDGALGAIPFLGDVFDFFFKANVKNVRLYESVTVELETTGRVLGWRHWGFLASIAGVLVAVMLAAGYVAIRLLKLLISALG